MQGILRDAASMQLSLTRVDVTGLRLRATPGPSLCAGEFRKRKLRMLVFSTRRRECARMCACMGHWVSTYAPALVGHHIFVVEGGLGGRRMQSGKRGLTRHVR